MKLILNILLRGLLAFVPLVLTFYIIAATITWLDSATTQALAWFSPEFNAFPGAGILLFVASIFLLGLIVSSRFTRWLFYILETPLRTLPLVKDVYGALNQLAELFKPKEGHEAGSVVRVSLPGYDLSMVGLIMRRDFSDLPSAMQKEGQITVYLPMGYQVGGFTIFVPLEWVEEIEMGVETALRQTLTGWAEESKDE